MNDELRVGEGCPRKRAEGVTPLGGWCERECKSGAIMRVPHKWEPLYADPRAQAWLKCSRCGAKQRRPEELTPPTPRNGWPGVGDVKVTQPPPVAPPNPGVPMADIIRELNASLEEERKMRHELVSRADEQGREVLDLHQSLEREREDRRTAQRRVRELEAESSDHEVIKLRAAFANRVLTFLTLLGAMGVYKLWLWAF